MKLVDVINRICLAAHYPALSLSFDFPGVKFIDQPVPKPQSFLSQTYTVIIHGASLPLLFVKQPARQLKNEIVEINQILIFWESLWWYASTDPNGSSYALSLKTESVFAYWRELNIYIAHKTLCLSSVQCNRLSFMRSARDIIQL